jgi:poly(ADP-ribose) glycohydrolase ARH3
VAEQTHTIQRFQSKIKMITLITVDSQRKSRFRGAIIGTAIGDALGAPTESMSKAEIEANPAAKITGDFIDHFRTRGDIIQKRGSWTDDTQLMIPLIKSITIKNCIDPFDQALRLKEIFESGEVLRGWSRSTIAAVERLTKGVPWFRAADTSLGVGNGVAMRAAPLGLYLSQIIEEVNAGKRSKSEIKHCINSIISVGKITHHELGITAGVLQSVLIADLINNNRSKQKLLENMNRVELDFFGNSRFSDKLKQAVRMRDISSIAFNIGVDSRADRSWITAVAVFFNTRKKRDVVNTMCELIKCGGDTDTNASMYSALVGAKWGLTAFPIRLRKEVENSKGLIDLADKLFEIVV